METKTIESYERATSSVNGNPAYWVHFTDGSTARTMSDAGTAYEIGNSYMREGSEVEVDFTRAGRIRYMREAKADGITTRMRDADGNYWTGR